MTTYDKIKKAGYRYVDIPVILSQVLKMYTPTLYKPGDDLSTLVLLEKKTYTTIPSELHWDKSIPVRMGDGVIYVTLTCSKYVQITLAQSFLETFDLKTCKSSDHPDFDILRVVKDQLVSTAPNYVSYKSVTLELDSIRSAIVL